MRKACLRSPFGAFLRFKDTIYRYGVEEGWFRVRDETYKENAVAWLEDHGFPPIFQPVSIAPGHSLPFSTFSNI